jgi:dethiobiotin synthetase
MIQIEAPTALKLGTYFVTGTDTDVGKTICTKALLQAANKQNQSTLAYKPISAGCEETDFGLRNSDALILKQHSSIEVNYEAVNPIAYKQPIAPHIAAIETNSAIDISIIDQGLDFLQKHYPNFLFVEGAGGWHLPINNKQLFSEWVIDKKLPVIIVIGLKLGCLNHALLTVNSIEQSGLTIAGWIANHLQPNMEYVEQNIQTLKEFIVAPLIGIVPYLPNIENQDLSDYITATFKE